ncbi:MAG TPA: hypothetical protein VHE30_24395 [Polyangiaceae bacterium]|nr:hypothetical protein [Polyangiaceae bacterium]
MSDPKDPKKSPIQPDDDVDGLLESLTTDEGYREELATIPVDPEPLAAMTRKAPGAANPVSPAQAPTAKPGLVAPKPASALPRPGGPGTPGAPRPPGSLGPRLPQRPNVPGAKPAAPSAGAALAGGSRVPRPGAPRPAGPDVRTGTPPAVNPAGPPRREPFPPAASPAPGRALPRPGAKLPGPAFDDAEIDAALQPLSAPPPPMAPRPGSSLPPRPPSSSPRPSPTVPPAPPTPAPPPTPPTPRPEPETRSVSPVTKTAPPPPTARSTSSAPPDASADESAAESWRPPIDTATTSLDDLGAVDLESRPVDDEEDLPETRQSAELPAVGAVVDDQSKTVPPPARPTDEGPSIEAAAAALDWDEGPTSIQSLDDLLGAAQASRPPEGEPAGSRKSVPPPPASTPAPPPEEPAAPDATVEYGSVSLDDLGVSEEEADAALGSAPNAASPPASPATVSDPGDHRPAAAHLGDHRLIDAWVARAEWFEDEADASSDAPAKARLLLAASELWAMAGNSSRARDAAKAATQASAALGLAARQARAVALVEGDMKAVALSLDSEARSAAAEAARAHAAYVASEVYRRALSDPESAERRLDLVVRASPGDPRPYLQRAAAELAERGTVAKVKWPDASDVAPLRDAANELVALRGKETSVPEGAPAPLAFEVARRALASGERSQAGRAIATLRDVPGIGDGALFLAAALLAPSAETRPAAIEALVALEKRDENPAVRRALAARSLEQGDGAAMERALASDSAASPVFTAADKAALAALSGADATALSRAAAELADDEAARPLAAAVAAVAGATLPIGDPATRALLALGRALGSVPSPEGLKETVHAVRASAPNAAVGRILSLELDAAAGATSAVAAEVARLAPPDRKADGSLAAALIEEAGGHADIARRQYSAALGSVDVAEAAVRALLRPGESSAPDLLSTLAESLDESLRERKSLLLYEAAMLTSPEDGETVDDLLIRAHEAAKDLPFATRRGAELARGAGDAGKLLRFIELEREAATEPMERALAAVREALLVADEAPERAKARVQEALDVRSDDAALHDLAERFAPEPSTARGKVREDLAAKTDVPRTRARLFFEAATEYERAGDPESAARAARAAAESGGSVLAKVLGERIAKTSGELPKEGLLALRADEQAHLGSDDDTVVSALSEKLSELSDPGESTAHARLAARLAVKQGTWESAKPFVYRAARHASPTLWALRQTSAHARVAGDAAAVYAADRALADRIARPTDRATLSLRAAEAAVALGRPEEALPLLDRTLEAIPEHFVARDLRARLREAAGDARGAAEDLEAMARAARLPEHVFLAWYRAGVLYADAVSDVPKALEALEAAAAIDVAREDVFDRLQLLYVQRGDRGKLASLLERRLEKTTDPGERIALEVTRGRALSDVGDREGARRALSAALEASPDHVDALEAFAALCVADGDHASAEQAYIRLARLATDPEKQASTYEKLAALYDQSIPNPQREEICYREILKRRPNDVKAIESLIRVHGKQGDAVKAIELQNGLLDRASTPEEKRDRTLELATLYDVAGKDKKSAFTVLEKARKAWPHDSAVLRALAEHHVRHGETAAASVLLDRAAAEARRALAHGRFDVQFFGILGAALELRGGKDAADVARATVAALEGKEGIEVGGAGARAADRELDDLLAPDLFSPALRALLVKVRGALDAAYPVDLKALRATPAPATELVQEMRVVAESVGLRGVEFLVSPALGPVFLTASSAPPRLVMGQALLDSSDDAARYFSLFRALKILQTEAAAFTRIPPIELLPATSALLAAVAPGYQPQGVDAGKLADAKRRIAAGMPARVDDDAATLALEVGGSIGNRASQLGQAVGQWGSRAALLAVGSPAIAFRGVALVAGLTDGPPADPAERLKWVVRQAEAKDLAVFAVSDGYAEARKRLGLA